MSGRKTVKGADLTPYLEQLLAEGEPAVCRRRLGPSDCDGSDTTCIFRNPRRDNGWEPAILEDSNEAQDQWEAAGLHYPFAAERDKARARSIALSILALGDRDSAIDLGLGIVRWRRDNLNRQEDAQDWLKRALPHIALAEVPVWQPRLLTSLERARTLEERLRVACAILARIYLTLAAILHPERADAPRSSDSWQLSCWSQAELSQRLLRAPFPEMEVRVEASIALQHFDPDVSLEDTLEAIKGGLFATLKSTVETVKDALQ